jgi:hypothetical protein
MGKGMHDRLVGSGSRSSFSCGGATLVVYFSLVPRPYPSAGNRLES